MGRGAPNAVRARLEPRPDGRVHASLIVERVDEPPYEREVVARTCDEALEAVAFMVAVALDPAEAPDAAQAAEEPQEDVDDPLAETPSEVIANTSSVVPFVGAGVQAVGAVAPDLLLGAELTGGVEWRRDSLWSPSARLSLGGAARDDLREAGGTAKFTLAAATLELCPLVGSWGTFSLRPCAFGTAGRLRAVGRDTVEPQTALRPWWVLGGALLLTWNPVSRLRLSAAARAGVPGVRDTFAFEPYAFHRVPAWAPSASIGAEVPFP